MGAIAGPDSAAESELRKLLPESFFKYYGTFLRRLWRENVYRLSGLLWALATIAVTFVCMKLVGVGGAGSTARATLLASVVLGLLWLVCKFIAYAPRDYEEGRMARRDHLILQARIFIHEQMQERSAECLRTIDAAAESPVEASVIHRDAGRIAARAAEQITVGSDIMTLHPKAAEEILAAVGPEVPASSEAAIAEVEELRRVLETQVRTGRFLSAAP